MTLRLFSNVLPIMNLTVFISSPCQLAGTSESFLFLVKQTRTAIKTSGYQTVLKKTIQLSINEIFLLYGRGPALQAIQQR